MTEEIEILRLTPEETYQIIATEEDIKKDTYQKIRFGINIKFDIYDYLNENFILKRKKGLIMIRGKVYKTENINTEIEERMKIAKRFLIKKYGDSNIIKSSEDG